MEWFHDIRGVTDIIACIFTDGGEHYGDSDNDSMYCVSTSLGQHRLSTSLEHSNATTYGLNTAFSLGVRALSGNSSGGHRPEGVSRNPLVLNGASWQEMHKFLSVY